ncbi:acyltransferase family protein [Paenibacillus sp. NPDC058174]|uniref:acyltransferase family protein n=1 Tax=Paenibacillus sp. NPDC058174 TaxID=3346366 RepID=UPI0036D8F937
MPDSTRASRRYMPGLDGLRAIAVLAVIAYHLHLPGMPGGLMGVTVFFVLSGYLITDILFMQRANHGRFDLKSFWIRRARRLLPAMLLMIAAVSLWLVITDTGRFHSLRGELLSSLTYVYNWQMIFQNVSYFERFGPPSPFGHIWSLAVEEQFYLVWPLVLVLLLRFVPQRGKLALWLLGAAACSALLMALLYQPGEDPSRVYYGTDTRAFALLIGAALAVMCPSGRLSETLNRGDRRMVDAIGVVSLLVIAYFIASVGQYDDWLYRGGMLLVAIATAAATAVLAHPASRLSVLFGSRPLRWIGVRSYGIYLYHFPIIALSTPLAEAQEFHPLRALLQLAATLALAELSYRYVEVPIRQNEFGSLIHGFREKSGFNRLGRESLAAIMALVVLGGCLVAYSSLPGGIKVNAAVAGLASDQQGESADLGEEGLPLGPGVVPPGESEATEGALDPSLTPAASSQGNGQPNGEAASEGTAATGGTQASQGSQGEQGEQTPAAGMSVTGSNKPASPPSSGLKATPSTMTTPSPKGASAPKTTLPASKTTSPASSNPKPAASSGAKSSTSAGSVGNPADGITVIGDSVILDAAPYLEKLVPGIQIDGKVGRQMKQAITLVEQLKKDSKLGSTVVIELGTNGAFTKKQLMSLLDAIGKERKVFLVNTRVPRDWQNKVNEMIGDFSEDKSNVSLIDWFAASEDKKDYFGDDGVHLKKAGAKAYAAMVAKALDG